MLLSISLKNWKSFEEKTTFTMEASKEQRHRDTLADFKKFRLKLLPIAAIFGSNASGKSNFVKAFSFVQRLLLEPAKGLSSPEPFSFRLDETLKVNLVRLKSNSCLESTSTLIFCPSRIKRFAKSLFISSIRPRAIFCLEELKID